MALDSLPHGAVPAGTSVPTPPTHHATLGTRAWLALALLGLIGAALLSLPHSEGLSWNVWLFLTLNPIGGAAPGLWSIWTVSGLGLTAYVALAAVDAPALRTSRADGEAFAAPDAQSRLLAALIYCFVLGGLLTQGAKHLLHAARPVAVLGRDTVGVVGDALLTNSMPSGHATTAAAMATLLCLTGRLRLRWQVLAWVWALGVMASRIAVGAHWPVDVGVGFGLGIAIAHLGIALAHSPAWPGQLARVVAQPWALWAQTLGLAFASASLIGLKSGYPQALPLQWTLGAAGIAVALWRGVGLVRARLRRAGAASTPAPDE